MLQNLFSHMITERCPMSLKVGSSQAIFSFIDANHRYIEKSYTVSHRNIKPNILQMFECFVNSLK